VKFFGLFLVSIIPRTLFANTQWGSIKVGVELQKCKDGHCQIIGDNSADKSYPIAFDSTGGAYLQLARYTDGVTVTANRDFMIQGKKVLALIDDDHAPLHKPFERVHMVDLTIETPSQIPYLHLWDELEERLDNGSTVNASVYLAPDSSTND
jgi:hypothetical protein